MNSEIVRVLTCRPVAAAAKLAFTALSDLCVPGAEDILPRLPESHRLARQIARAAGPRSRPSVRR